MKESEIDDLLNEKKKIQSTAEMSLTESNAKMSEILRQSRTREVESSLLL